MVLRGLAKVRRTIGVSAGFLMAVSLAGVAEAAVIRPFQTTDIDIPGTSTFGEAAPYPSELVVSWCQGTIQDVNIELGNLTHTEPIDIDLLLVGPGGQNAIIMSDAGDGTTATDVDVTLDDEAAITVPAPLTSGDFQPTNVGGGDTFTGSAPTPSGGSALSVFDGTNPNGIWRLFAMDDNLNNVGDISSWTLEIDVGNSTAPSATGVCVGHVGPGEPFPSTATLGGLAAPIQDVNVSLAGLTHTYPDDLDILLAGPGGTNVLLTSDAGGSENVLGINLTFDDEAAAFIQDEPPSALSSGNYKPSNFETLENLPGAAPATQGTSLATFDGLDPNGTWSLYLNDDVGGDFGTLQGWSLQIATPGFTISPAKAKEGKKATFTVTRTGDLGQAISASFATAPGSAKPKDFKGLAGTLNFAAGDATEQVVVKAKNDNKDEKKNEKFSLNLTSGQATFSGLGKIKDTDK